MDPWETFAVFLMNSMNLKTGCKKRDFERDQSTERWDLINSEGVTVEVKSTKTEGLFGLEQAYLGFMSNESLGLKLFMEKDG